ncbi:GSCOCG00009968001-RA-CDS [Cotesia congregata]|nr:GSCOCG00009968001-RA-CDS [Cotesia congregata]
MLWRLQTASMLGRIHVEIINASMWTATRSVVHTANAISISVGTFVSVLSCTSTIATIANPESNAEVLEEALSFARLSCNFLQER